MLARISPGNRRKEDEVPVILAAISSVDNVVLGRQIVRDCWQWNCSERLLLKSLGVGHVVATMNVVEVQKLLTLSVIARLDIY
jgi:hypothetical protein